MITGLQQRVEAPVVQVATKGSTGSNRQVDAGANETARADGGSALSVKRTSSDTLRAGFGEGTVSVPGATIRTLGKGLDGARRVIPTLEELQEARRKRLAEQRDTQAETTKARETRQPNAHFFRASQKAAFQAQGPVNELDQAAETAQARNAGNRPRTEEPAATVQINGQTMDYFRARTGADTGRQPALNVLA